MAKSYRKINFIAEEGRQDIYHWSERRQKIYKGYRKSLHMFRVYAFNAHLLRSFIESFNYMVILQMVLAALATYACKHFKLVYDVHVSLFISPIVFPLAFSINADFQRREKVLDDLANFKSSAIMLFFCMRDWKESCDLDDEHMKAIHNKIKGLMFHLREFLLTENVKKRKFIARVVYEDLSDINQLIDKIRCSKMTSNSPLVSRITHFLYTICLSFERLRVIREYRSPRSIRSFTKVLIFVLPILLSPYYIYLSLTVDNEWGPYYISIMVAFVFGALQGVQDKLDNPFDGMSEDDIKLDSLDEWTFQSLEATVHRTFKIGRFQVSQNPGSSTDQVDTGVIWKGMHRKMSIGNKEHIQLFRKQSFSRSSSLSPRDVYSTDDMDDLDCHPYAGVLNNIKGNTTIRRGGQVIKADKSFEDPNSLNNTITAVDNINKISIKQVNFKKKGVPTTTVVDINPAAPDLKPLFQLPTNSRVDGNVDSVPSEPSLITTLSETAPKAEVDVDESEMSSVISYPVLNQDCSRLPSVRSKFSTRISTSTPSNASKDVRKASPAHCEAEQGQISISQSPSLSPTISPLIQTSAAHASPGRSSATNANVRNTDSVLQSFLSADLEDSQLFRF